ncbi:hypothetical protein [Propionivibrio sp.]|uniref:hypothetical protein n=1 Tax=Propionivibrio sp. TaxID=2212460 RepID=UPI003BF296D9
MSRKPAILELSGGKSGRQRVWEAIRFLANNGDHLFDAGSLSLESRVNICPVREYLKGLDAAGYVRRVDIDDVRFAKNVFELARDNGVEAPRVRRDGTPVTQGRGTEAMWGVMTALDNFNHWLVAEIAQVKPSTASHYCQALGKAGYLQALTPGKGKGCGGVATVWAVAALHRMKPRAPMITRLKSIYDPNIHQIVWGGGPDEAADALEVGEVIE